MRIRTQFIFTTVVFGILLLVFSAILVVSNQRTQDVMQLDGLVRSLQQDADELGFLTSTYLLFQEPSQAALWRSKLEAISARAVLLEAGIPQHQNLVENISDNRQRLAAVFTDIRAALESGTAARDDLEYIRTSWSRMQVQSQAIISDAAQLSQLVRDESNQVEQTNHLLIVGLFLGFGILIMVNYVIISRHVVSSLSRLQAGTRVVGSGDLGHDIPEEGKDEFSDLTRAFNRMTANLRNITASKAELEREIAERKEAEENLKRTMVELTRSNRDLEQFAYVASHDLQEPLRMMASFIQLLEKRYRGKLGKDADEFIGFIVEGSRRMQNMIQGLLQYSRVGTRGKPFQPADFNRLLEEVTGNLRLAIEENRAVVTHDPMPIVSVDATQMIEVLQNLIGNAIKFRREEPPRIHVSASRRADEWVFSVKDNGIGIAPEYFARLFTIFQRLHSREDYPGAGIGLAISKKIVERHDGRIWVESRPGAGSTFYFSIPDQTGGGHGDAAEIPVPDSSRRG